MTGEDRWRDPGGGPWSRGRRGRRAFPPEEPRTGWGAGEHPPEHHQPAWAPWQPYAPPPPQHGGRLWHAAAADVRRSRDAAPAELMPPPPMFWEPALAQQPPMYPPRLGPLPIAPGAQGAGGPVVHEQQSRQSQQWQGTKRRAEPSEQQPAEFTLPLGKGDGAAALGVAPGMKSAEAGGGAGSMGRQHSGGVQKRARLGVLARGPASLVPVQLPLVLNADRLGQLQEEILGFVAAVAPSWEENTRRDKALGRVLAACRALRLHDVHPFGSKASELELWNSDIDVVVLGLTQPTGDSGGFTNTEKVEVNRVLADICKQLKRSGSVRKIFQIRSSRVPIIKALEGVDVDVSLNSDGGLRAADFLHAQQAAFPALRPLALLLKALLKGAGLADVSQGGLGSFALTNMIIAHLQEEAKEGRGDASLGVLQLTFMERYGERFRYGEHAVAVAGGGIVRIASLGAELLTPQGRQGTRIYVEDPLTKREVAGGSYCMDAVRDTFAAAAARLRRMLGRPGQATISMLNRVFPLQPALSRNPGQHAFEPHEAEDDSDGEPDLAPGPAQIKLPAPQLGLPPVTGARKLRGNGVATPGLGRADLYSKLPAARAPGSRPECLALFLDPSGRKTMLDWARPRLGTVAGDCAVLQERPDLAAVAEADLGAANHISVTCTADNDQAQVLMVECPNLKDHLVPCSSLHVVVSLSEGMSPAAAGKLAEAVGAGHLEGVRYTRFPQPGRLTGTLGLQLQNGHLFFSHAELASFWEEAEVPSDLSDEASSLLEASEEGLEPNLDVGFFGALPGTQNGLHKAPSQKRQGAAKAAAGQGGGGSTAGLNGREDWGRWMQEAESEQPSKQGALPSQNGAKGPAQSKEVEEAGQDRPLPAGWGPSRQHEAQAGSRPDAHAPAARRDRQRKGSSFSDKPPRLPPHLGGGGAVAATRPAAEPAAKVVAAAQPPPAAERGQHAKRARDGPGVTHRPQQPLEGDDTAGARGARAGPPKAPPATALSAAPRVAGVTATSGRHEGEIAQVAGHAAGAAQQYEGSAIWTGCNESLRANYGTLQQEVAWAEYDLQRSSSTTVCAAQSPNGQSAKQSTDERVGNHPHVTLMNNLLPPHLSGGITSVPGNAARRTAGPSKQVTS